MTFWEKVESELKFQNKTRKQLATEIGIDPTTISKGISNNSIPAADVALKISSFLNTSLEVLLEQPEKGKDKNYIEQQNQILLYKKYHELIDLAERLNEQQLKSVENLMKTMSN